MQDKRRCADLFQEFTAVTKRQYGQHLAFLTIPVLGTVKIFLQPMTGISLIKRFFVITTIKAPIKETVFNFFFTCRFWSRGCGLGSVTNFKMRGTAG